MRFKSPYAICSSPYRTCVHVGVWAKNKIGINSPSHIIMSCLHQNHFTQLQCHSLYMCALPQIFKVVTMAIPHILLQMEEPSWFLLMSYSPILASLLPILTFFNCLVVVNLKAPFLLLLFMGVALSPSLQEWWLNPQSICYHYDPKYMFTMPIL